jgi:hypothetical protein
MSPRSTLAQQWSQALTSSDGDQFTIHRRTGPAIEPVAGPFDWVLSMIDEKGAQPGQNAMLNLQATHRAAVFDDAMAVLQGDDQVRSVRLRRMYQVRRIEPGQEAGGGTLYLAEVKGA